jgi:hypothetical protein
MAENIDQNRGGARSRAPVGGSPLLASMDEYISDLEKGNHITWDGDDFFGLLEHLKEVRVKMANDQSRRLRKLVVNFEEELMGCGCL